MSWNELADSPLDKRTWAAVKLQTESLEQVMLGMRANRKRKRQMKSRFRDSGMNPIRETHLDGDGISVDPQRIASERRHRQQVLPWNARPSTKSNGPHP